MTPLIELPRRNRGGISDPPTTMTVGRIDPPAVAAGPRVSRTPEQRGRLVAGRYRLRSLLGRGGMGRVFLADDELLHRPVALKQHVGDATTERILDEARAATRVRHDGAVSILDVVQEGGLPWIVMEALSGRTLGEAIHEAGYLPIADVRDLALRLLDVLQAVHRAGVVHRDVKPSNVHICDDGRVVLTDFGIACIRGETSGDPVGTFVGSLPYIAPELLRGDPPGPTSDLFALGATLFVSVEGRAPFDERDVSATVTAVLAGAPAPFLRAGTLQPVIAGLLEKDPERRLTAGQARDALPDIVIRHGRFSAALAP